MCRTGIAAVLLAVLTVAGCGGPSRPSSSPSPTAPATSMLTQAQFLAAMRRLRMDNTGTYMIRTTGVPAELDGMLPAIEGEWSLSPNESRSEASMYHPRTGRLTLTAGVLGSRYYMHGLSDESKFTSNCWLRLPDLTPGTAVPSPLGVLAHARVGSAGPTMRLSEVLTAIGLNKVVRLLDSDLAGQRVPVSVQVTDGRLVNWRVTAADLDRSAARLPDSETQVQLRRVLGGVPQVVWSAYFAEMGVPIYLEEPTPESLIVGDDTSACT